MQSFIVCAEDSTGSALCPLSSVDSILSGREKDLAREKRRQVRGQMERDGGDVLC